MVQLLSKSGVYVLLGEVVSCYFFKLLYKRRNRTKFGVNIGVCKPSWKFFFSNLLIITLIMNLI